jgi:hypothetical protein
MLNSLEAAPRFCKQPKAHLQTKETNSGVKRFAALVNYMVLAIAAVDYLKATSKRYDDIAWR